MYARFMSVTAFKFFVEFAFKIDGCVSEFYFVFAFYRHSFVVSGALLKFLISWAEFAFDKG